MSFGLNMRDVSYVTSYASAVAMYDKGTAWRGEDPDGERPLHQKRQRQYGVRMDDSDVVFRYHTTDVIRWHKDDSYTIYTGGYHTPSTCTFASNFMPQRHYLQKEGWHLQLDGKVYPLAGNLVTVSADGVPSGSDLGMFTRRTVNRKSARDLLVAVGYPAYREWYTTMFPMVRDSMPSYWRREHHSVTEVKRALKDPEAWHALMMSDCGTLERIREVIYDDMGDEYYVWEYTHKPWVTDPTGWTVGR